MSAARLREAAALIRERAEAADGDPSGAPSWYLAEEVAIALTDAVVATEVQANRDAPHIASWHPGVALAVADLLEDGATYLDYVAENHADAATGNEGQFFLAVADAYLGGRP